MNGSALVCSAFALLLAASPAHAAPRVPSAAAQRQPCAADEHHLRFVNKCAEDVWVAEVGNSSGYCTADSQCLQTPSGIQSCAIPTCQADSDCPAITCTASADCPTGGTCLGNGVCTGTCNTSDNTCYCTAAVGCPGGGICSASGNAIGSCQGGLCTFTSALPKGRGNQRWHLVAAGTRGKHALSICAPETWQGRFWGRTGCTLSNGTLTCVTGQCGTGEVDCAGNSATGVTLFEPTFDAPAGGGTTVDYYDVSLVSGYNVPVEVRPSVKSCVASGGCTTDLNETCPAALQITNGTCTTSADCTTGTCVSGSCVVGCSDPCTICTNDPSNSALDCANNADEYCCHGSQQTNSCNSGSATCFSDDDCTNLGGIAGRVSGTCDLTTHLCNVPCTSDAQCPGSTCNTSIGQCESAIDVCSSSQSCPTQVAPQPSAICTSGIFAGSSVCVPVTDCCGPYNPSWLAAAALTAGPTPSPAPTSSPGPLPTPGAAAWPNVFKAACPQAYSYQYDDPSSSFTCAPADGKEIHYVVTFCPHPRKTSSPSDGPPRSALGSHHPQTP